MNWQKIKNLRCVASAMLSARTVGWKGAEVQVPFSKAIFVSECFPTDFFQQALVSIVQTLSFIYLPWRLNGKMIGMMMVISMRLRVEEVIVVLIWMRQVPEGDDGGICCSLPTGGRS